jgi:tetratricopeptide (TPR) repeat protein
MRAQEVFKSERGLLSSWVLFFMMAAVPAFAGVAAIRDLLKAGKFAEANQACDQELKAQPSNAALWTLKGFSLQGIGDSGASLKAFRSALKVSPSYAPALQAAAQLEFEARDARAQATLAAILKLEPTNLVAHSMLGELAFESRDCVTALAHLSKVEQKPAVRWQQGVCHFALERWMDAATNFEALLKLREHAPTRFNLALSYWRAGSAAQAVEALQGLDDADSLSLRGSALKALKQVPKALEVLQAAVRQYPNDERLFQELALMCLDQNAIELGVSILEAGVRNNPSSVRLLTALGVFRVRLGETEKAEVLFAEARRLAPKSGLGEVATASTLMQLGLAGEAVRVLRKLPANEPMVALTLARALLFDSPSNADKAEARNLLAAVIAREPSNVAARSLLGKTLAQDGATQQALLQLEAALKLDPSHRATVYQLMTIYKKQGRQADASRMGAKLRELLAKEKAEELEAQEYQLSLAPVQP